MAAASVFACRSAIGDRRIDAPSNRCNERKSEEWNRDPECRQMLCKYFEGIESGKRFSVWKFDVQCSVERVFGNIRCVLHAQCFIAEINCAQPMQPVKSPQHRHAAPAEATGAVVEDRDHLLFPHPEQIKTLREWRACKLPAQEARDDDRSEQRDEDTNHQCHGKSADDARTDSEENRTGDER